MKPTLLLVALSLTMTNAMAQSSWTQLSPANSPGALSDVVGSSDATGMLVFGGKTPSAVSNELWRFDLFAGSGGDWINMNPSGPLPAGRQASGAAYDTARDVLVIFGGRTGSGNAGINGETWEWDALTNTWTDKTPAVPTPGVNTPAELENCVLVYEPSRSQVLLFGGRGNTTTAPMETNETWSWNGTTWTKLAPVTSPPARRNFAMGHDKSSGITMVWGGIAAGTALGDTWIWDGSNWSPVPTATTPFNNGTHNGSLLNRLVYDGLRERFVLTCGVYPGGTVLTADDTYEFDGVDWVNRGSSGLNRRYASAVAYVEATQKTYSYGGYRGGHLGDTWEYQTNRPASFVQQSGGCAGAGSVPTVQAAALPWIGDEVVFEGHATNAGAANFLWFGATTISIPLSGFPGCTLEIVPFFTTSMPDDPITGLPTLRAPIPFDPTLAGAVIYSQLLSVSPGLQLSMSARGDSTIGRR